MESLLEPFVESSVHVLLDLGSKLCDDVESNNFRFKSAVAGELKLADGVSVVLVFGVTSPEPLCSCSGALYTPKIDCNESEF